MESVVFFGQQVSFEKSRRLVNTMYHKHEPQFEFHKRSQLFIRTHNEPLSVVAMRTNNPDLILTPATLKVCKQVFKVSGRQGFRASLSAPGLVVVFSDCDQRSGPSRLVRNGF